MLEKVRKVAKKKGQGIVEYALLLAFIVGIAMMLNGSNLGSAVNDMFDEVALVLGGGEKYDLSTPEGRKKADYAAMKKIGKALQNSFSKDGANGTVRVPKNFVHLTVFSDGTVGLYVDGGPGWTTDAKYMDSLKSQGVELDSLKLNDTTGEWKNGYTVFYDVNNQTVQYQKRSAGNTINNSGHGYWYNPSLINVDD